MDIIKNIKRPEKQDKPTPIAYTWYVKSLPRLAILNNATGFYYVAGHSSAYPRTHFRDSDVYTPVFEGESVTLEF